MTLLKEIYVVIKYPNIKIWFIAPGLKCNFFYINFKIKKYACTLGTQG